MARHILSSAVVLAVFGACLFVPAGRLDWPMAWVVLATYVVLAGAAVGCLDPDLLQQREAVEHGAKRWDPPLATGNLVLMILLPLVVSGWDVRRTGGTLSIGPLVRGVAFVLFVAGQGFGLWAMRENRFFAKFVRIQRERGHRVVTSGPYRIVRHPGYAGGIVSYVALPVALGSVRGAVVACAGGVLLVVRTWLEDRTLRAELDGYGAYAARVRWRLLPGVW